MSKNKSIKKAKTNPIVDPLITRKEAAKILNVPVKSVSGILAGLTKSGQNAFVNRRPKICLYRLSRIRQLAASRAAAKELQRERTQKINPKSGAAYHYQDKSQAIDKNLQFRDRKCPVCGDPCATGKQCCSPACHAKIKKHNRYDADDWGCSCNVNI